MKTLNSSVTKHLAALKENGSLSVLYALLAEALLLGYLGFITLFTLETLLPTFVTLRFSLTKFFLILFLFSFVLSLLGRYLGISFERKISKKNPWLALGFLWILGILSLSLYKFPTMIIIILLLGFFFTGFLFWKILFDDKQ